jgi:hypothetical protein
MFELQKILFLAFIYLSPTLLVVSIIFLLMSVILKIKGRNYKKLLVAGFIFLATSILIFIVPAIIMGTFGVAPD